MCGVPTTILGSGEENEVGSMEQTGQHVARGGNEQLCGGTQEGLCKEAVILYNLFCTLIFLI